MRPVSQQPSSPPVAQPTPVSAERRAKIDAARQAWIRQLVDMSRRNNLLYFRDLKVGTLELTNAPAEAMQELLQSAKSERGVALNDLVLAEARTQAAASLAEIAARARSNFDEKGLETLFLALGLASWTAADGGRESAAPILLMPLQATQTSGRRGSWSLKRSGELKVNDVLVHALREEHGLTIDGDTLAPSLSDLRTQRPEPVLWPALLRAAWLRSCLEEIHTQDPSLPAFRGSLHDEIAAEFRDLDKQ